jgi:hypothetical protein
LPVLAAAAESADAPTVGLSADRTTVLVGDRVTLTVSATAAAGTTLRLPPKPDLGGLELLDRDEGDREGKDLGDGRRAWKFQLIVAGYDVAEITVPPIEISWSRAGELGTVRTKSLTVAVRGVLPPPDAPDKVELQPPRGSRSSLIEDRRMWIALRWTAIVAGGALALALIWLIARRVLRRRAQAVVAAAPVVARRPPEEVAVEKLAALEAAGQFDRDRYRPFYFAAAEILREYLGARYGFDSLELTSGELMDAIKARTSESVVLPVQRFTDETDLVKFANTSSTDGAAREVLAQARAIILATAKPLDTAAAMVSSPVRPMLQGGGHG